MVSVPVEWVATGANASSMVGLAAAALPDGSRVVSTELEFTSLLWPFLAQERGIEVECVPVPDVARSVDERTGVVAVSWSSRRPARSPTSTRSSTRRAAHGARVVVDATQACGWLPVDASRIDVLACSAYKWLCSPRGTAFMTVRPELAERLTPHAAGWYAGEDPYASFYGPPLRLAKDARRFDLSPAWFPWARRPPPSSAARHRRRGDPRARPRGSPTGSARGSGCRPETRRSSRPSCPTAEERRADARHGGGAARPAAHVVARLQHG